MLKRLSVALWLLFIFPSQVLGQINQTMRVHFIDVGQGDATLIEFPCASVLIDTGGEMNPDFDGTAALIYYLDNFFENRDDLEDRLTSLILTHPHKDHTNATKDVLEKYTPDHIVTNGQTRGSGRWGQIAAHKYSNGHDAIEDTADDIPFRWIRMEDLPLSGTPASIVDPVNCGSIDPEITVLWGQMIVTRDWGLDRSGDPHFENENNHSLALKIEYGDASMLLTGDMEDHAIDEFVEHYSGSSELDVDVYQVGHHGSINGTTVGLVEAMSPEIAVFSMGDPKREISWSAFAYGHPRTEVVSLLQEEITRGRDPIQAEVGLRARWFQEERITQAVYATGWDGDVVLEATPDGNWTVISPANQSGLINVNSASVSELISLPGIGPVKAQAIVSFRAQTTISSLEVLDQVPGIGPATLVGIQPYIEF